MTVVVAEAVDVGETETVGSTVVVGVGVRVEVGVAVGVLVGVGVEVVISLKTPGSSFKSDKVGVGVLMIIVGIEIVGRLHQSAVTCLTARKEKTKTREIISFFITTIILPLFSVSSICGCNKKFQMYNNYYL